MSSVKTATLNLLLVAIASLFGCKKQSESDRVEYTLPGGKKTSDVRDLKDGTLTYQISGGGQKVPERAKELHRQARAKGESGDYASAIKLLRQASEIAPNWAYPYYDMAFTYLLQGDVTNALLNYRETDRLEPRGFFTAKTALWTLERENNGTFPKGTYLAYVSLEWTEPDKKRDMIQQMTTHVPAFAPGWKERAWMESDSDKQLAFIEKALALDPDPETYGICVLNKATRLGSAGKTTEARRIIEELATNDSSTISAKALAKEALKTLTK